MKKSHIPATMAAIFLVLSLLTGCGNTAALTEQPTAELVAAESAQPSKDTPVETTQAEATVDDGILRIARQGMFSSGGTVTDPIAGDYDPTTNWLDVSRSGNTAHVDHANVFYQIPATESGNPIVYLHGYGQSRMGWMTTPDGREGWSDIFLRYGHAAFLVDQPHRGEAGAAVSMTNDGFLDAWAEDSKDYKPGD